MRVLWLCNIVLPELASTFGFTKRNEGGWLTGAWRELINLSELNLAICVPVRNPSKMIDGENEGYNFYSFLTISQESNTKIENQIERFKTIICDFKPDIIHVWGTEFEHSYSMVNAAYELGLLNNVVVNIQGLISECAKVFTIGIDKEKQKTYRIEEQLDSYITRAQYEVKLLRLVKNVSGRTDWDKTHILEINPTITYFYCGEILRNAFYKASKWNYKKCEKHSVFISQAGYPIKGIHLILDELKKLCEKYSDLKIRIAGPNLMEFNGGYPKFVVDRIYELQLIDNIEFLGELTTDQMIEQYQKANVFLSSSIIENSSNSICEAMMIGTPVVSSLVGGIPSIITHGISGYLYSLTEIKKMSYFISKIFEDKEHVEILSKVAISQAESFNNRDLAMDNLYDIYSRVAYKYT
ncbi:Glycosyltransferase involved in cell wall bisynthesis [Pseudobutyrivibrio ruminis]|uniref:Glycosyltransferase involved in cell wall bisynthesis n=1 Tax=Pseudobutyrivibrio ruminis TaxID=46206 RepID=A0A1H7J718_9FIRM|nr:glycosyltransferase [Pseudobutyrivibrio ruminis]SEK70478.1 Glycosyltransferase involved in cell wall bisynthesis [Pseudobutyrivibrio ruminis]